jgi:glycosyltransferase involved in cell wall biosynthesis
MVVAMRNEEASIEACLASLAAQDYPEDLLQVVVYDGASTDRSVAIAQAFTAGRPGWEVRSNPRRIQAAAWNAGIAAASGDVVGIVSGHAELGPGYVRRAVEALDRTQADMVGGPVRAIGDGAVGRAVAIAISTPFGVGGARHRYLTEPAEVDTVFMGVCRRETWIRFPFDETMVRNQDDELSYRLLDAGGRIVCDPAIESRYRNPSSFGAVWRQFFDYGRWKVPVLTAHPRQVRPRHLAPGALVIALLGGAVAGLHSRVARRIAVATVAVYASACVGAAIRYRDRQRPASAAILAAVYPILHLAYGSGMLAGSIRLLAARRRRAGPGSPR